MGGWSQGGILSYLLATRRNIEAKLGVLKIKGAICGPGGKDLDMLVITSDRPYMQGEVLAGRRGIGREMMALKRMRVL